MPILVPALLVGWATRGYRLDIAAGTAVRFEPGQGRTVRLVRYGGLGRVFGFQGKVMGNL